MPSAKTTGTAVTRSPGNTRHGAHKRELVAPIRGRHLKWLQERFPGADVTILGLQASRLAQLELVGGYLDDRGIIRNRRYGTVWPAADYWARTASAFERQHERLEAQHAANGSGKPAPTLAEIEAELAGEDEGGMTTDSSQ